MGYDADARVIADAAGGGVCHGDGDVGVYDSMFLTNYAYVWNVDVQAQGNNGIGETVYALFDGTAQGGGLDTGDGMLTIGSVGQGGSSFGNNYSFLYDVLLDSDSTETATSMAFASASGGGINHGYDGTNTVSLTDSYFGYNVAYVYDVDAYAGSYTTPDTATAFHRTTAPSAAPIPAISSSAWNVRTPNRLCLLNSCRMSEAGVIGYAPKNNGNPARRDAAINPYANARFPLMLRYVPDGNAAGLIS